MCPRGAGLRRLGRQNGPKPLFREARYLLAEEPDIRDHALYHAVLAALAEGNATRGGVANYLDRKAADVGHPLDVLEDAGLIHRDADAFRDNRSEYRIAEPLIDFYHAIMRPVWDQLERPGAAERVWQASQKRFSTKVLGPHFEQVCREWALHHADPELLGGLPARVGHGQVHDPTARTGHQVDVAVIGIPEDDGPPPLLALGEAKWNATMGDAQVERLAHIRDLITRTGRYDTSTTRLLCLSGGGFSPRLTERTKSRPDLLLVRLDDLYASSR